MKHAFLFFAMLFATVATAISQTGVPPVISPDDSLPVLGTVMLDPSDHPVTFHSTSSVEIVTRFSFDFSGSARKEVTTIKTFVEQGVASAAVSTDGGVTFHVDTWPAVARTIVQRLNDSAGIQIYSTEMTQLDISGGGSSVMLRESPTLQSTGQTTVKRLSSNGGYRVSSFFDVFLELSMDGGATWTPADNSVRLVTTPTPTFVVDIPGDQVSPPGVSIGDLNGDGHPDLVMMDGASSPPMPPVGSSVTQSFSCNVLYLYGGFQRSASAACSVQYTRTFDDGSNQFFDVEMLQMDISGGTFPAGVMIRESPTQPSRGQTEISAGGGGYRVSSFFDVFTEFSTNGGATWTPQPPFTLTYSDTLPSLAATQPDVPAVVSSDDLLPVFHTEMLDPSDRPLTFHSSSFFDVFTELSLDFSGSQRKEIGAIKTFVEQAVASGQLFDHSRRRCRRILQLQQLGGCRQDDRPAVK